MAGNLVTSTLKNANIGDAINVVAAGSVYKNSREKGDSRAVSVVKAGADFAWGEILFGGANAAINAGIKTIGLTGGAATGAALVGNLGFMAAYIGVSVVPQAMKSVWEHNRKTLSQGYGQKGKLGSGYFNMTDTGYTMRQRSLNAIRQNGLNTQSVLGNEARNFYRGSL